MPKLKAKTGLIALILTMAALAAVFLYVPRPGGIQNNYPADQILLVQIDVGYQSHQSRQSYAVEIESGASVLQAMQKLSAESDFRFSGKEFSGLGYFVEEINGIKGDANQTWIYYVNGVQAPVGVSQYVLKASDTVSFKYEKII